MTLDEKDITILHAVATEETGSPEALHQATGIPKSTVQYRLDNLREDGIITNDLDDVDYEKAGLRVTVITEVMSEYKSDYHYTLGAKLSDVEGVNQVYYTMGDTDFVVISHLPNHEMVETLIERFQEIDEIERTSSKSVITTIKPESRPFGEFELETLTDVLG